MGEEEEEILVSVPTLNQLYNMVISTAADLLDESEIIIFPDRAMYQVPFAALRDETGKYLSETYRIRIVPSLTTLQLIKDSTADYHSQTEALIVGDPYVGDVVHQELHWSPLLGAIEEAEMIGQLLGVQPLLGKEATKQAVLQRIHSVSLAHFATYSLAKTGEIVLAPSCPLDRIAEKEEYLLTTDELFEVRLRAKLVVLSCCYSARGQITFEGVFLGSSAR